MCKALFQATDQQQALMGACTAARSADMLSRTKATFALYERHMHGRTSKVDELPASAERASAGPPRTAAPMSANE
jgi:hypothetical protein